MKITSYSLPSTSGRSTFERQFVRANAFRRHSDLRCYRKAFYSRSKNLRSGFAAAFMQIKHNREYELLKASLGSENCTLVWNPGGHFQDGDKRLAAAFSWCIKALEGK